MRTGMSDLAKYKTKVDWERINPVLRSGVPGFEDDTGKLKIGDGVKKWSELSYQDVAPYTLPSVSTANTFGVAPTELNRLTSRSPRPGSLLAIAMGDSTTAGDSVHPNWYFLAAANLGGAAPEGTLPDGTYPPVGPFELRMGARSWFHQACWQSGGRLRPLFNAAQGSDRTPGMVARFPIDVIAKKPDIVFLGDARNDWGNGIPTATSRANILKMIDMAQEAGITVVLVSIYPDDDVNFTKINREHNVWLRNVAQARRLAFCDKYAAVADPADGTWLASMQLDGVHASYLGAKTAGAKVLADLTGILSGGPEWLPSDNVQNPNILKNGLFLNNIGSYGNTFNTGSNATVTYETDATSFKGRAAVVAFTGASNLSYDLSLAAYGYSVGDRLKWAGLARVRNAVTGNMKWNLEMQCLGQGDYIVRPVETLQALDMGWFYYEAEFVVPAGATVLRIGANILSGTGEVSFAQQGLYNLTKFPVV